MPQPPRNGGTYQVHCSGAIVNNLKQIQRRAKIEGRGPEVLSAIRHIWHYLSYEPRNSASQCIAFPECIYKFARSRLDLS